MHCENCKTTNAFLGFPRAVNTACPLPNRTCTHRRNLIRLSCTMSSVHCIWFGYFSGRRVALRPLSVASLRMRVASALRGGIRSVRASQSRGSDSCLAIRSVLDSQSRGSASCMGIRSVRISQSRGSDSCLENRCEILATKKL